MEGILLRTGALSTNECLQIIDEFDSPRNEARIMRHGPNFVLHYKFIEDPSVRSIVAHLVVQTRSDIRRCFAIDDLFVESVMIAALQVGGSHKAHADCEKLAEGRWVPNHTPQRAFSAVTYLQTVDEGGELQFVKWSVRLSPREGLTVIFPSTGPYTHCVSPVIGSRRFSIAAWFTTSQHHEMTLQLGVSNLIASL